MFKNIKFFPNTKRTHIDLEACKFANEKNVQGALMIFLCKDGTIKESFYCNQKFKYYYFVIREMLCILLREILNHTKFIDENKDDDIKLEEFKSGVEVDNIFSITFDDKNIQTFTTYNKKIPQEQYEELIYIVTNRIADIVNIDEKDV